MCVGVIIKTGLRIIVVARCLIKLVRGGIRGSWEEVEISEYGGGEKSITK